MNLTNEIQSFNCETLIYIVYKSKLRKNKTKKKNQRLQSVQFR